MSDDILSAGDSGATNTVSTSSQVTSQGQPGVLGGAMIVAGTAIGAGMFALPIYSAGMWFGWSMLLILFSGFCSYSSAMYLTEAALQYRTGASYSTIAEDTLGPAGKLISTLSVAFVCYICTYAYVSGGSGMVSSTFASLFNINLSAATAGLIFSAVLAFVVFLGSRVVDRLSAIMIGGMVLTFLSSVAGLSSEVSATNLLPMLPIGETSQYIWVALPVIVTSFGYQSVVPSLVKHYRRDTNKIKSSVMYGTLLTASIYLIWEFVIMGTVPRDKFTDIIAEGGNVINLINAVGSSVNAEGIQSALMIFGKLALASSFLGVTLGLMDMIKDLLGLSDSVKDSAIAGAVTFVPPVALAMAFPNGFLVAIGYASLVAAISFFILPPLMAKVLRKRQAIAGYKVSGGTLRLDMVLYFGVIAVIAEVANLLGLLPNFG